MVAFWLTFYSSGLLDSLSSILILLTITDPLDEQNVLSVRAVGYLLRLCTIHWQITARKVESG
jgi:hypothetical protein